MPTMPGRPVSSAATTTSLVPAGTSKMQPWSSIASSSPGRAAQAQIAARPSELTAVVQVHDEVDVELGGAVGEQPVGGDGVVRAVRADVLGDAEERRPPLLAVQVGHPEGVLVGAPDEQAEPVVETEVAELVQVVAGDGDTLHRGGHPLGPEDTGAEEPGVRRQEPRGLRHEARLT
ncbi:hypothetical protein Q9Q99_08330 [Curtobacterium flaccumfaciens]|nr:hypothetical protein Q9Q99_08330 [Curtobacterium flaccumfaciens]